MAVFKYITENGTGIDLKQVEADLSGNESNKEEIEDATTRPMMLSILSRLKMISAATLLMKKKLKLQVKVSSVTLLKKLSISCMKATTT